MSRSQSPGSVKERIAGGLRTRILDGRLAPGDRLIEKDLCEQFAVSRPSLREALGKLAQEGLVTQVPHRGYHVTRLSKQTFRHLCELRRIFEQELATLAAERASPRARQRIVEAAPIVLPPSAIGKAAAETRSLIQQNRRFHLRIAEAAGNPYLLDLARGALDRDNQPYFYDIDLHACTSPDAITREHLAIAKAISEGDAKAARQLMRQHLEAKEERVLNAWNRGASPS